MHQEVWTLGPQGATTQSAFLTLAPPQWGSCRRWGVSPQNTLWHLGLPEITGGQPLGQGLAGQGCYGVPGGSRPDSEGQVIPGERDTLDGTATSQGHEMGGNGDNT